MRMGENTQGRAAARVTMPLSEGKPWERTGVQRWERGWGSSASSQPEVSFLQNRGSAPWAPPAPLRAHSSTESQLPRLPSFSFLKCLALQFRLVFAEPNQHCKQTEGVFIYFESKTTKRIRREAFNSIGSSLLLGIKVMMT